MFRDVSHGGSLLREGRIFLLLHDLHFSRVYPGGSGNSAFSLNIKVRQFELVNAPASPPRFSLYTD